MITAIVLAAGMSKRMPGKNKMFLPFRDTTIISNVIGELVLSDVDEIIIVADSKNHENELAIISQVKLCVNPEPQNGLTSSIQTGLNFANPESDYLICLGDMPLISFNEYNLLINKRISIRNESIIQPIFNNKPGNPILFSNSFRKQILELDSPNGCKPIVQNNIQNLTQVQMPSDSIHFDIDTENDYIEILDRISKT